MNGNGAQLSPLDLVAYCMTAQQLGASQRQALRQLRGMGHSIRTATFRDLWQLADDARKLFGFPGVERR